MRRIHVAVAFALLTSPTLLGAPAAGAGPSAASTVTKTSEAITIQAGGEDDVITAENDGGFIVITSLRGVNSKDCIASDQNTVSCSPSPKIKFDGGDGNDNFSATGTLATTTQIGGAGKDDLTGDAGKDTLKGGDKNDRLSGRGGDDRLLGGKGKDTCKGGPGKDTVKTCE